MCNFFSFLSFKVPTLRCIFNFKVQNLKLRQLKRIYICTSRTNYLGPQIPFTCADIDTSFGIQIIGILMTILLQCRHFEAGWFYPCWLCEGKWMLPWGKFQDVKRFFKYISTVEMVKRLPEFLSWAWFIGFTVEAGLIYNSLPIAKKIYLKERWTNFS